MTLEIEVLVVGGGPAGLAAATEAARSDAEVVLVDEGRIIGGWVARLGGELLALDGRLTSASEIRSSLQAAAEAAGVTILRQSLVWSIFPDHSAAVVSPGENVHIRPKALILAPGAVDVLSPFQGWVLPGVLTAEEALRLSSGTEARFGRTAVVAGVGGSAVPVVLALRSAGLAIAALAEAESLTDPERSVILAAEIPYFEHSRVAAARGRDYVETTVLSTPHGTCEFRSSVLILATRQLPQIDLCAVADCAIRWAPELASHIPVRSSHLETSVAGIYVAGAGGGICGLGTAIAEGRLAGGAVAAFLLRGAEARLQDLAAELESVRTAERVQLKREVIASQRLEVEAVKEALDDPDMILCRCEQVPVRNVRKAIDLGARMPGEVKGLTRVGMGECQGRNCRTLLSHVLGQLTGTAHESLPPLTYRPPVRPLTVETLLRGT